MIVENGLTPISRLTKFSIVSTISFDSLRSHASLETPIVSHVSQYTIGSST